MHHKEVKIGKLYKIAAYMTWRGIIHIIVVDDMEHSIEMSVPQYKEHGRSAIIAMAIDKIDSWRMPEKKIIVMLLDNEVIRVHENNLLEEATLDNFRDPLLVDYD